MNTLREQAIAQVLLARLSEDRRTFGQTIDVSVLGNDLFLVGWCDTEDQKASATMIAQGTYGVRSVIDNIRVREIVPSI